MSIQHNNGKAMSGDPIEHLRKHVEFHKGNERAMFSIAGLKALLDALDDARGLFVTVEQENVALNVRWLECCSNTVALTHQRDTLKAQVERLLVGKGKDISKALREAQTSRLGVMDECDEEETG